MAPSTPKQLRPSQIDGGPIGFGYTQDERPFMYTEQVHNMTQQQFVTYFRVSTARQGISGLGLDAQRQTVTQFLAGGTKAVMAEFVEVETGKGSNALERRPELRAALEGWCMVAESGTEDFRYVVAPDLSSGLHIDLDRRWHRLNHGALLRR